MTTHLIFDLDGTLVDSSSTCCDILSEMLAERGSARAIDRVAAREYMSCGGQQMVAALLGDCCGDVQAELTEFRQRYAAMQTPVSALFPGVAEGLSALRESGFDLSICSNKPQNLCEKVMLDTGLAPLFSEIVGGAPDLRPKPAPDLLDEVVRRLAVGREHCLFIGDSELDHDVARSGGIAFLFVTYGYAAKAWAPEVGVSYDRFADLAEAVVRAPHSAIEC
jgi:phosphoglycolate phosphatase